MASHHDVSYQICFAPALGGLRAYVQESAEFFRRHESSAQVGFVVHERASYRGPALR